MDDRIAAVLSEMSDCLGACQMKKLKGVLMRTFGEANSDDLPVSACKPDTAEGNAEDCLVPNIDIGHKSITDEKRIHNIKEAERLYAIAPSGCFDSRFVMVHTSAMTPQKAIAVMNEGIRLGLFHKETHDGKLLYKKGQATSAEEMFNLPANYDSLTTHERNVFQAKHLYAVAPDEPFSMEYVLGHTDALTPQRAVGIMNVGIKELGLFEKVADGKEIKYHKL